MDQDNNTQPKSGITPTLVMNMMSGKVIEVILRQKPFSSVKGKLMGYDSVGNMVLKEATLRKFSIEKDDYVLSEIPEMFLCGSKVVAIIPGDDGLKSYPTYSFEQ